MNPVTLYFRTSFNPYLSGDDESSSSLSEESSLKKMAENDPQALYDRGLEYKKNIWKDIKAFNCFKRSAKLGSAAAQNELGDCYLFGSGVEENPKKAYKWYKRSAEQGYPEAFLALGCCYYDADGVEYDFKKARKWWKLAMEQGVENADSCYWFSEDYVKIEKKNLKDSLKVAEKEKTLENAKNNYSAFHDAYLSEEENLNLQQLMLSAGKGDALAQFNLGVYYYDAETRENHLEESVKWWEFAADQGQIDAQYNLSICNAEGIGATQNLKKAFKWCRVAALQGDLNAQNELANLYFQGKGVNQNIKKAIKCWTLAKEEGHIDAQYNLGLCEENKEIIEQSIAENKKQKLLDEIHYMYKYYYDDEDLSKGMNLKIMELMLSAKQGDLDAQLDLARHYFKTERGIVYSKLAALQGSSEAQYALGFCYLHGHGVEKNLEQCKKWLTLSADQGNQDALKALNQI